MSYNSILKSTISLNKMDNFENNALAAAYQNVGYVELTVSNS